MAPSRQSTGSAIVRFYDPDVQAKDALGRTQKQVLAWSDSQLEYSHNYIQMLFPLPEGSPYNWSAPVIDLETLKAFRARSELRQQLRKSFERMLVFYGFKASTEAAENEPRIAGKQKATNGETASTSSVTSAEERTHDGLSSPSSSDGVTATTDNTVDETSTKPLSAGPDEGTPSVEESSSGYYVSRGPDWRKASRNWCVRMDHNHLRITRILRCLRVLGLQAECDAFFAALKDAYNDPAITIGDTSMVYWTRAVERPLHIAPDNDKCGWLKAWTEEQEL